MAQLVPGDGLPLVRSELLALTAGGAESNVAMHLAALGHPVSWLSRLGDDPFGHRIVNLIDAAGVDTSLVGWDDSRPTGLFLKDPRPTGSQVHYYRAGSAASAMSVDDLDRLPLGDIDLVHLSGITPALSVSCAELVDELMTRARAASVTISFDVNHRPGLWDAEAAGPVLLDLARRADVVLVGRDEGERLWGTGRAADIRGHIGATGTLVVKDADVGATEFGEQTPEGRFVPALPIEVLEPVGAGDAFAAGYLAGLLHGYPCEHRLAVGHRVAARSLTSLNDHVPITASDAVDLLQAPTVDA